MRAKRVIESVEFQRGIDPYSSLGIGKVSQRDFSNETELIEWGYRFPITWSGGEIAEWNDSDKVIRKPLDEYHEEVYVPRMRNVRLQAVKWIKDNITINGESLGLKQCMEIANGIQKLAIQEIEKSRGITESMEFEKGKDPKDALGIGVGDKLKMEGIDALTHFFYYVNAEDMIQKVWNGWDHIRQKLISKVGKGHMDPNALMSFIRDLDTGNQEKLYKYILKYHSNKW